MSINFTSDIGFMLKDAGGVLVTMSVGGATTYGIFEQSDTVVLQGDEGFAGAYAAENTLLVQTGSLPGLTIGTQLVIAAVTYKVRDFVREEDGALTRIMLET